MPIGCLVLNINKNYKKMIQVLFTIFVIWIDEQMYMGAAGKTYEQ